jgi:hypothetical protein
MTWYERAKINWPSGYRRGGSILHVDRLYCIFSTSNKADDLLTRVYDLDGNLVASENRGPVLYEGEIARGFNPSSMHARVTGNKIIFAGNTISGHPWDQGLRWRPAVAIWDILTDDFNVYFMDPDEGFGNSYQRGQVAVDSTSCYLTILGTEEGVGFQVFNSKIGLDGSDPSFSKLTNYTNMDSWSGRGKPTIAKDGNVYGSFIEYGTNNLQVYKLEYGISSLYDHNFYPGVIEHLFDYGSDFYHIVLSNTFPYTHLLISTGYDGVITTIPIEVEEEDQWGSSIPIIISDKIYFTVSGGSDDVGWGDFGKLFLISSDLDGSNVSYEVIDDTYSSINPYYSYGEYIVEGGDHLHLSCYVYEEGTWDDFWFIYSTEPPYEEPPYEEPPYEEPPGETESVILYDNSTDEGTGNPIILKEGEYIDYEARDNWDPANKTLFRDPDQHDSQGFRTFYFEPPEEGEIELEFENIDPDNPAYIDGVQIERDFTQKWPSIYTPGEKSHPIKDILLTPGIGRPLEDGLYLLPNLHAFTHHTGGDDEITPISINAADRIHGHDDAYLNKTNTTPYEPTADYHPATKQYVDEKEALWPEFMEQNEDGLHVFDSDERTNKVATVGRAIEETIYYNDDLSVGTLVDTEFTLNGLILSVEEFEEFENFENETFNLAVTGDWARSTRAAYNGSYSLESSNKTHNSNSNAYITFNCMSPGKISLAYRVSSESAYDKLFIYLNGVTKVNGISGNGNWIFVEWDTLVGENVLQARYTKDGSVSTNLDAGFIDFITITYDVPKESGYRISPAIDLTSLGDKKSKIRWGAQLPEGSDLLIETGVNSNPITPPGSFEPQTNGSLINNIPEGSLINKYLWIKSSLLTTTSSPTLESTQVFFEDVEFGLLDERL